MILKVLSLHLSIFEQPFNALSTKVSLGIVLHIFYSFVVSDVWECFYKYRDCNI